MAFLALLDACVLYPLAVRDTLLNLADVELYRPLWSKQILEEAENAILRDRPDLTRAHLDSTFNAMRRAFPDAGVRGYEHLVAGMTNHSKDRHVLAAAVAGGAGIIVTDNVPDFAESSLAPWSIEVKTADDFLLDLLDLEPDLVIAALVAQAERKKRPPVTFLDMLDHMTRTVPKFSVDVRNRLARSS